MSEHGTKNNQQEIPPFLSISTPLNIANMKMHCLVFIMMVYGMIDPLCVAFQSPTRRFTKRFISVVSISTRINAAKIPLVTRSPTMTALEPVFNTFSSFFQTHMKSKMVIVGHILATVAVQLIPFAFFFCLYKFFVFVVSLGQKNDPVDKQESTSNIIEASDSNGGTTDQANRLKAEQRSTDAKEGAILREQAKINAEVSIQRIAAEEEARTYRLQLEKEARKKEEAYKQQARLLRFKQQRAAEKAGQYTYSTPLSTTSTTITTNTIIGSAAIPKRKDTEVDKDTLGAAVVTAALVGLQLGGPLGALIGAASVNYFGKKTATKGVIRDTGNVAIGTVDLLKSVDEKFAVVRGVEKALLDALKASSKDEDTSSKFQQSYEQTKSALEASIPVGKDVLGATMDVTEIFFEKMEELQTMNVTKENSTSDNDGSDINEDKNDA